jgi:hypothetical protein
MQATYDKWLHGDRRNRTKKRTMMRTILLIMGLCLCLQAHGADSSLANFICDPVTDVADRAQCIERASVVTRHETGKISQGFPWGSVVWPFGWWVVYYAFGLLIGRYIYRDASARQWIFLGIRPVWWGGLALFEPAFGLLVYWALHYSKFSQSYHEATAMPAASVPNE